MHYFNMINVEKSPPTTNNNDLNKIGDCEYTGIYGKCGTNMPLQISCKKHVGVGRLICTLKQLYFLAFKSVTNQIFFSTTNLS